MVVVVKVAKEVVSLVVNVVTWVVEVVNNTVVAEVIWVVGAPLL